MPGSEAPVRSRTERVVAVLGQHRLHHREHGFVERHVHDLSLAGRRAVVQRHQRADHAEHRRERVADRDAHAHRRAVGIAGDVAHAAHRLADRAEAGLVLVGSGLPEAREPHHDEARVVLREPRRSRGSISPACRAGNSRPRCRRRAASLRTISWPSRRLQVHRDRFLVARLRVPPERVAFVELAPLAQRVALAGRLDLDHLGAELGEQARAVRTRDERAELDDLEVRQGALGFHPRILPNKAIPTPRTASAPPRYQRTRSRARERTSRITNCSPLSISP